MNMINNKLESQMLTFDAELGDKKGATKAKETTNVDILGKIF